MGSGDFIHFELAHYTMYNYIILDRNEIWAQDLYHSTALIEEAKSSVLSNVHVHVRIYIHVKEQNNHQNTIPET